MRAVILAAGQGSRLRPLTNDKPKCLVELAGEALLDRQASILRSEGLTDLTVLTGYRSESIRARGYETIFNPDHETTNMVYTLFCAEQQLMQGGHDLIIAYGDIQYERRHLRALLASKAPISVVVDLEWRRLWDLRMEDPLADAETLRFSEDGRLQELGRTPRSYDEIQGQYIGLIKVSADHLVRFAQAYRSLDRTMLYDGKDWRNMYMTSFLQHLIDAGWLVQTVPVRNGWLEVDSVADLETYERLHKSGELREIISL